MIRKLSMETPTFAPLKKMDFPQTKRRLKREHTHTLLYEFFMTRKRNIATRISPQPKYMESRWKKKFMDIYL